MKILASKKELLAQIEEVKKASPERKFPESIELAINIKEVDLTNPKSRINEEIALPKGRGKDLRVAVFGTEDMKSKAKNSADFIYGPEDLSKFAEFLALLFMSSVPNTATLRSFPLPFGRAISSLILLLGFVRSTSFMFMASSMLSGNFLSGEAFLTSSTCANSGCSHLCPGP